MQIEIWTDIICPWCGLGKHRLQIALQQFVGRDRVELRQRSFQLDPAAPRGEMRSTEEMLQKRGFSPEQIVSMGKRIEALAQAEGLSPYHVVGNQVGSTAWAHEWAAWATDQGKGEAAWEALYQRYFAEGRSIFTQEDLLELTLQLGLSEEAAQAAWRDGTYSEQVKQDMRAAQELGVSGVPFVLINQRYAISGAQPVELILQALQKAWEEEQAAEVSHLGEGAVCGPSGCEPS